MYKKLRPYLPFIILFILVVIISYGQTLGMYFWQDDSALIFKLQHQAEASGSFGVGLWERSPYQYLVVPFVPFFNLFKLEPFWYFLVGLISYAGVAAIFYLFSYELFKEKKISYFVTLIFSAGYIGSDIMFRVINSWQTNIGLFLSLVTLLFYVKYFNTKNIKNYFQALFLFFLTIEAVYIRSHSFIFVIFSIDLLFTVTELSIKSLRNFIVRQIPFWFLFYKWYLSDQSIGSNSLSHLVKNILGGDFEVLTSLFATVGNSLVPDILQTKFVNKFGGNSHLLIYFGLSFLGIIYLRIITKNKKIQLSFLFAAFISFSLNKYFFTLNVHWYRTQTALIAGFIGIFALIFSLHLSIALWQKSKSLAMGILLGYLILISQIFGYFIQYPDSIFGTTHRYLSNSFVGYCLLYGSSFYIWYKSNRNKIFGVLPYVLLISLNLIFGFEYQKQIVQDRSIPSRQFYASLKHFVPQVAKGSLFYFDIERNPYYERQFNDFFSVGSMPETTAIAIYYGIDRYDVSMFTNFDELVSIISQENTDFNKVYTFYYGKDGLQDTSNTTRRLLEKGGNEKPLEVQDNTLIAKENISLTPQVLRMSMKISESKNLKYPYSFSKYLGNDLSVEKKLEILRYLKSKEDYYKTVKVTSLSEWKYSEINYVADNNVETSWQSHRSRWDTIKDDNVTVDLGTLKNINEVIWTNSRNTLTPTDYKIYVSKDGQNWKVVKGVVGGAERKNAEIVEEKFDDQIARFVKMQITKTLTEDSPSIAEFEVVESGFDIVLEDVATFINNPFGNINDSKELGIIYSYFKSISKMKLKVYTDKNQSGYFVETPIFIDDYFHDYELVLPQSGTKLKKIEIVLNFPADVSFKSAGTRNTSLKELKNRGLIKFFSIN